MTYDSVLALAVYETYVQLFHNMVKVITLQSNGYESEFKQPLLYIYVNKLGNLNSFFSHKGMKEIHYTCN